MSSEEIKALEKEVSKLKFKANMKASEVHDLVEDRLLTDFEDLPAFAAATYEACKAWSEKNKVLLEKKKLG